MGRASNIKNRLYNHLQNKHSKNWDYFSVYFTLSENKAKELESIILSIIKPKGNTQKPMLKDLDKKMIKRIQKKMKLIDKKERQFGTSDHKKQQIKFQKPKRKSHRFTLAGYFSEDQLLQVEYKKRSENKKTIYSAVLLTSGKIKYQGKEYSSLSTAAEVATGLSTMNGWTFWCIKNSQGEWVKLDSLRKEGQFQSVA